MKIQITLDSPYNDNSKALENAFNYPTYIEWPHNLLPSIGDEIVLHEYLELPKTHYNKEDNILWKVEYRVFRGDIIDFYLIEK